MIRSHTHAHTHTHFIISHLNEFIFLHFCSKKNNTKMFYVYSLCVCPLHAFKVAFYAENETFIPLMEVLRLGGTCKYRNTAFFECLRLDFLFKKSVCVLLPREDHNFLIKLLIYCRLIAKMVVFVWCGL